jgi:quinohemoprotein ethanol dehydrogenase
LRRAGSLGDAKMWNQIVIGGALTQNGMISWKEELNDAQAENIRLYVINRAHEDKALGMD